MLLDSLIVAEDKINHHHGTGKYTWIVATVAIYILVLAGRPAVPGFYHKVAGLTEIRVMLCIVIEIDELEDTKRESN